MFPAIDPKPILGALPSEQIIEWNDPQPIQFVSYLENLPLRSFADVLHSRRSVRVFGKISLDDVAAIVRMTLRITFVGEGIKKGRFLKVVASAGALHPVKAVILQKGIRQIYYNDVEDKFLSVAVQNEQLWNEFLNKCQYILTESPGFWILLFADCRNLNALYENFQSLLFRDAGAVIQALALVAESNNLALCPLGILGNEALEALLPNSKHFTAVGIVGIGGKK